ncbi:hypothetical protein [Limnoglobus roseus]|uniref:Uncharacterized protein n=1 Tax=Limnoglobus roseus TaxID=2598579 RepID=A0A5C1A5X0_9BACT|nr:hypothetical protein [Limnoglobus roseus]QEL14579.1 hypothetical protein PX52LOC_01469 [Limnoglobus roseus]
MSPSTILILTFVGLVVGLFAFFWGTALFLQAALYNTPADKLPIRAALAAFLVGGFLTFWTFVNTRAESKDRYGTFFEFNPTSSSEFHEFTAVRRDANKKETSVPYKKVSGNFVEVQDATKPFKMNSADYMVSAIEVKDGEKPVKFDAQFDKTGKYAGGSNKVFQEVGGRRYIEFGQTNVPSAMFSPSTGAMMAALGLNALHFVVWFVALWPVLRYTMGHAIGGAAGLGLFVMLLVMPLLFDKNKLPDSFRNPPPAAAKA